MNGWLIYDSEGAKRNEWFIQKFIAETKALGHTLTLCLTPFLEEENNLPDFAVVRTINPKINRFFEEKRVPVFNGALTAAVACDKWQTYLFCQENGIEVLPTKRLGDEPPFAYPFVIKARDGHGGSEVFLVKNEREWKEKLATIERDRYIAQPLCDEVGKDMRVYALGDNILVAMLRISKSDFRSNFSLGGSAEKTVVEEEQKAVVSRLKELLNFHFVGVDFIRHRGKWILNEIEDSVGTRMLYKHTEIDAVKQYARYIFQQLSK